jgi:peptidoglycan/LPS O-acetylase OafA/YrhL
MNRPRVFPNLPASAAVDEHLQASGEATILQLALMVVPAAEALAWFREDPIRELGERTAAQLNALGQQEQVIAFLQSILLGQRD